MRKNIVAGNWKMNKLFDEGLELATQIKELLNNEPLPCEVIILPSFIHLPCMVDAMEGSVIKIGAQNCSDKAAGAYTGEVSAAMIKSTGASYVIVGHSERRQYYGETSAMLKNKVEMVLANNLTPIFCFGEMLREREENRHFSVVKAQIEESLFSLPAEDFARLVLAYEPVWAIGTGKTATAGQAQEMHAFVRAAIAAKYNATIADNTSILYGGSCNPSNARELFLQPDVDGGLIGGSALVANDFVSIIKAFL
ncbi:MAG: triose-phosphate isomerase [Prevotellaceae bacterium]|jgi:triosephosphate isomerase|nr:triose-phosphate isomerase [Prevotellaceae bacterium]